MSIPIDITRIHWDGAGISRFEITGNRSFANLQAQDPTATVEIEQRAQISQNLAQSKVAITLCSDFVVRVGAPSPPTGIGGRFELRFFFTVANLAELTVEVEGHPAPFVHPQLAVLLVGLAYSTARGILWTRLAGTALEGITLPIIAPGELLQAPAPAEPEPPQVND